LFGVEVAFGEKSVSKGCLIKYQLLSIFLLFQLFRWEVRDGLMRVQANVCWYGGVVDKDSTYVGWEEGTGFGVSEGIKVGGKAGGSAGGDSGAGKGSVLEKSSSDLPESASPHRNPRMSSSQLLRRSFRCLI
jgi:hypothetical protein